MSLRDLPFAELDYATVDHHRALRQGALEVIFGHGKTAEQIAGLARELVRQAGMSSSPEPIRRRQRIWRASSSRPYDPLARVAFIEARPVALRPYGGVVRGGVRRTPHPPIRGPLPHGIEDGRRAVADKRA